MNKKAKVSDRYECYICYPTGYLMSIIGNLNLFYLLCRWFLYLLEQQAGKSTFICIIDTQFHLILFGVCLFSLDPSYFYLSFSVK